jgi:hypothetical protein
MMTGAMTTPARAGADLRLLRAAVFAAACVALSAAGHAMASDAAIPVWALLAGWAGVFAVAAPLAGRERSLPGIAALMLAGQVALHVVFSTGQWCAAPSAGPAGGADAGATARVMALAGRLVCHSAALRLTPADAYRVIRQAGIDPASLEAAGAAGGSAAAAHAAVGMAGMPGMAGMAGMAGMPGMTGAQGAMGYTVPMLAAHLVAALVAGWLLWRGEAALWRLVRLSGYAASWVAVRLPLRAAFAAVRAFVRFATRKTARKRRRRRGRWDDGSWGREPAALRHCVVRRGPPRYALAA